MSEPQGNKRKKRFGSEGVYTLRINYRDGRAAYPVMIDAGAEDFEEQITEAEGYFEMLLKDTGYITVHLADNVYDTGVNDTTNLLTWKDYKKKHNIE